MVCDTTLTLGSRITVRGQNGAVGYSLGQGGPQIVSVINEGVVSCDVGGGTISVQEQPLINQRLPLKQGSDQSTATGHSN